MISVSQFKRLFNDLFLEAENTLLVDGAAIGELEPVYRPATDTSPAQIIFAHGFLTSALHETAHWCYAGPQRRQLEDYGYWYAGDDRDAQQQRDFEQVEVIPQAYELLLSEACGVSFQVSLDNFNPAVELDRDAFTLKVKAMAEEKVKKGLSLRLLVLLNACKKVRKKLDMVGVDGN